MKNCENKEDEGIDKPTTVPTASNKKRFLRENCITSSNSNSRKLK